MTAVGPSAPAQSPTVLTLAAEASSGLLLRTLGAHRTAVSRLPPRPVASRLGLVVDDRHQIQRQATFLRFLSVTEAFAAETLLRHAEQAVLPSSHAIVRQIWAKAATSAISRWVDQEAAYKSWLAVTAADVNWKPMHQLAEGRNAISHGLGHLTRQQQRDADSVKAKLSAVGVPLIAGRVVLDEVVLANAASQCRTFIAQIDVAVQRWVACTAP